MFLLDREGAAPGGIAGHNPADAVSSCYRTGSLHRSRYAMKNLLLPWCLLAPALSLAQPMLVGGNTSPNWTATDINGNSHTLYDYLDQGYTVILDFSATWCPPCASFHQSHVLKNLYEQHGPGTADDNLMVFLIESDDATDLADLNGTGDQSPIDWVTGTPYPIIDAEAVGDVYGVFGFPTIYTICPSRVIATHGYVADMAFMWDQCQVCMHQNADSPHDAALIPTYNEMFCRDASTPLTTTLINVGTTPLTSATIEAVECYDSIVVSTGTWTGSLGTYEAATVDLPAWEDAPPGGQCVFFRITTPDDDAANSTSTNSNFYAMSPGPSGSGITIELLTDGHGDHLAWRLAAAFGDVVDRRDAGELENNTSYTFTYTLGADTCWWFIISNDVVDAIETPGYYRLSSYGETFITHEETWQTIVPGSMFVDQAYFRTTSGVGVPQAIDPAVSVYPNPADVEVMVSGVEPGRRLTVHDATGRIVRSIRSTGQQAVIDIRELRTGMYTVVVSDKDYRSAFPLVVLR